MKNRYTASVVSLYLPSVCTLPVRISTLLPVHHNVPRAWDCPILNDRSLGDRLIDMSMSLFRQRWGMDGWWVKMMGYYFGSHLSTGEFYACLTQKRFGSGQWRWTSLTSSSAPSGQNALTKSGLKDSRKGENEWGSFLSRKPKRTVAFPCFDNFTIIYSVSIIVEKSRRRYIPVSTYKHDYHNTNIHYCLDNIAFTHPTLLG